jgi:hypothetical protein
MERPLGLFGGWRLIDTAPLDTDVILLVTDGGGEPYRNPHPCKRIATGWVSSRKGTLLAVTPLQWKPPSSTGPAWPQRTMPLEAQNALARHHTTDTSGRAHSRSRHCGPKNLGRPTLVTRMRKPNATSVRPARPTSRKGRAESARRHAAPTSGRSSRPCRRPA